MYNRYKPKGRKSFFNYFFVLKRILIMLGNIEYPKYIPLLKTQSKQKKLERVWNQITKDPECGEAAYGSVVFSDDWLSWRCCDAVGGLQLCFPTSK